MDIFKTIYPALPDLKSINLDLADIEDAGFIALLSKHYVESGMSGWSWNPTRIIRQIQDPDSLVIVGRAEGEVVAAAIVGYGEHEAHLFLLAVEPQYQRSGIGSCLVRYIENSAFLLGSSRMYLEVRASNNVARKFYRFLGYKEVLVKRNYYKGYEAAVFMMRPLPSSPTIQIVNNQISD